MANTKRAEILAKLKAHRTAVSGRWRGGLYLFGSYSRDEARGDSDLDLFVDPDTPQFYDLEYFVGAYEVTQSALPGHEISYGTRNGLSPYICPAVEQEAMRIF